MANDELLLLVDNEELLRLVVDELLELLVLLVDEELLVIVVDKLLVLLLEVDDEKLDEVVEEPKILISYDFYHSNLPHRRTIIF